MKIKISFQEHYLQFFPSFTKLHSYWTSFCPLTWQANTYLPSHLLVPQFLPRSSCGSSFSSFRSQLNVIFSKWPSLTILASQGIPFLHPIIHFIFFVGFTNIWSFLFVHIFCLLPHLEHKFHRNSDFSIAHRCLIPTKCPITIWLNEQMNEWGYLFL